MIDTPYILTLGLDRDSATVAHLFDERNDAVRWADCEGDCARRRARQAESASTARLRSTIRSLPRGSQRADRFDLPEPCCRDGNGDACRERRSGAEV
jgi:hypothetical protein